MPHLCVIAQAPEECPEAVAQLIEQCLEKEVSARPNARQVSEPNYFKHALKLVCMTKQVGALYSWVVAWLEGCMTESASLLLCWDQVRQEAI